jgi:glycosyltransferase involved in cell wall biosynthesis
MRLLIAVDGLAVGGAERHVVDLATALAGSGHRVTLACSDGGPLAADVPAGVRLAVLGDGLVKRRFDERYAHGLRALAREERPDVVHAHLYASAAAAEAALRDDDTPLVVTEQTEAPWRCAAERAVSARSYARARRVIAVSGAIRRTLVGDFGLPAEKVAVIPNAVVAGDGSSPATGLPRGRPLVGVVARLVPEKGIDGFLRAAASLAVRHPGAAFAIVGDGPLRAELEGQAAALGLDGRVRFLGARRDVRALLPALDVLAVPSRSEGTPLTIVEAMLAGTPVVATAVGGIPEQVDDGRTGLVVAPDDDDALIAALDRLLSDHRLARALAARAGVQARRRFGHAAMVRRIEDVYRAAAPPTRGLSPA